MEHHSYSNYQDIKTKLFTQATSYHQDNPEKDSLGYSNVKRMSDNQHNILLKSNKKNNKKQRFFTPLKNITNFNKDHSQQKKIIDRFKSILKKSRVSSQQKKIITQAKTNLNNSITQIKNSRCIQNSLNYSSLYPLSNSKYKPTSVIQSSINKLASNVSDKRLSKSNKKINFTIFQSRRSAQKANSKQQSRIQNQNNPIVQIKKSITLIIQQNSKTKQKNKIKLNSSKSNANKLINTWQYPQYPTVPLKYSKTMKQLQKYKFVSDYMTCCQIIQLLNGYVLQGQQQCKWCMMIIDQVFKKMRKNKQ